MKTNFIHVVTCKQCPKTFPLTSKHKRKKFCSKRCAMLARVRKQKSIPERFWKYVNKDGPIPPHVPHLGAEA